MESAQSALSQDGVARSSDGVEIAYSTRGTGRPAVVLVHGGLAHRGFWRHQLEELSGRYQIVTVDLAGHGSSGVGRTNWTMTQFGEDVRAVVDRLALTSVVLVGNSLGGPVAVEAAALLPNRVVAVVGVDTFQNVTAREDPSAVVARAKAFQDDPHGSCQAMVRQLFHPGAHEALRVWAEGEMCRVSTTVVVPMLRSFAGYDLAASMRRAAVPIRAINGDLWPTSVEANRTVVPDFDVVILSNAGHYPMLEQPEAFNRALEEVIHRVMAR